MKSLGFSGAALPFLVQVLTIITCNAKEGPNAYLLSLLQEQQADRAKAYTFNRESAVYDIYIEISNADIYKCVSLYGQTMTDM